MKTVAVEPLIGVINAGSSSLKFSFYEGERRILGGEVEGIGAHPAASAAGPDGEAITPPALGTTPPAAPSEVLPAIWRWAGGRLGHRRLPRPGRAHDDGRVQPAAPVALTAE